jgi:hypothetical protein
MLELPEEITFDEDDIVVKRYNTDELIVRPGDADEYAYIVLDGSLTAFISVSFNL